MADSKNTKSAAGEVVLKNVRLSYPHIEEPEASVANGPKKYSASFIIDPSTDEGKETLAAARAAFSAACRAEKKWPEDKLKKIVEAIDDDRKALRDGNKITNDEGDVQPAYVDKWVVKATRPEKQRRPAILDRRKNPVEPGDDQFPYAGCNVDAIVRFYTMTDKEKGGNGVFCGLEAIRFRSDNEAFGNNGKVDTSKFDDLGDDEGGSGFSDDDDGLV